MTDQNNNNSTTQQELAEPLLPRGEEEEQVACPPEAPSSCTIGNVNNGNANGTADDDGTEEFSFKDEIVEMVNLGIPLAVSFFCRMGMASTDSSFVGHIHDGQHTPETYLAAAVLSDMMVTLCITPPLAFNQVVSALVGQAMGSGNPKMAGIWLQQSMFWVAATMAPCLIGLFYVQPFLELLGFPEDISAVAGQYAKWNLLWPIPNGLYQCLRFYFQACGFPRPAMYNNLTFLGINALLNWFCVFGGPIPGWKGFGFIGAAISLSISRTMQGVCYYIYMFHVKGHHQHAWPDAGWSMVHHTRERTWEFLKQSLPNVGTLLFQAASSQATTVLVGRLGELSIAASSALSTVTIPWSGTLSATCGMVSGVRVGYHLGRGNGEAAKQAAYIIVYFITVVCILTAIVFIPLKRQILTVATDDEGVIQMALTLVVAMLVSNYLNLLVGNITSGVFSGQGRPLIATVLSFGLELPMSIGGVAIYILAMHGNLLGVYWWGAISGGIEAVIVVYLMIQSNWAKCADDAQRRQEADSGDGNEEEVATEPESSLAQSNEISSDEDDEGEGEEAAPLIIQV